MPRANIYAADIYLRKMQDAGFEQVEIEEIGASVIPGYYREQMRPESIRAITKIRGYALARLGLLLDVAVRARARRQTLAFDSKKACSFRL